MMPQLIGILKTEQSQEFVVVKTEPEEFQHAMTEHQEIEEVKPVPEEFEVVKTEPEDFEVVMTKPEGFEVLKAEPQDIDLTEMILPDWSDADTVTRNKSVVKETDHGLSFYAAASELRDESPVCHGIEVAVEAENQSIIVKSGKEHFECNIRKEEGNRISPKMNPGVMFSSDLVESMCLKQGYFDSEILKCNEIHQDMSPSSIQAENSQDGRTDHQVISYDNEERVANKSINEKNENEQCSCENALRSFIYCKCRKEQHLLCGKCTPNKCDESGKEFINMDKSSSYGHTCHKCKSEDCGVWFLSKYQREQHVELSMMDQLRGKEPESEQFGYKKTLHASKGEFGERLVLRKKQFDCPHCEISLSQPVVVFPHSEEKCSESIYVKVRTEAVDLNNKQYDSPHCEHRVSQRCNLIRQVQTTSFGKKEYVHPHYEHIYYPRPNINRPSRTNHLRKKHVECSQCEQKFTYNSHMKLHFETVHLKKKQFECAHCKKRFSLRGNMKRHIETVHLKKKLFECSHCGKTFGMKAVMKKHTDTMHMEKKEFKCPHCKQKFTQSCYMKRHIDTVHLKKKEFECSHCKHRFNQRCSMKKHIENVHLKRKEFECPHCKQRFSQKGNMYQHIETVHLKKKEFECPHCKHRFSMRSNMKQHIETVHLKEKQYVCSHCGKRFNTKGAKKKHTDNMHLKKKKKRLNVRIVNKGLLRVAI